MPQVQPEQNAQGFGSKSPVTVLTSNLRPSCLWTFLSPPPPRGFIGPPSVTPPPPPPAQCFPQHCLNTSSSILPAAPTWYLLRRKLSPSALRPARFFWKQASGAMMLPLGLHVSAPDRPLRCLSPTPARGLQLGAFLLLHFTLPGERGAWPCFFLTWLGLASGIPQPPISPPTALASSHVPLLPPPRVGPPGPSQSFSPALSSHHHQHAPLVAPSTLLASAASFLVSPHPMF